MPLDFLNLCALDGQLEVRPPPASLCQSPIVGPLGLRGRRRHQTAGLRGPGPPRSGGEPRASDEDTKPKAGDGHGCVTLCGRDRWQPSLRISRPVPEGLPWSRFLPLCVLLLPSQAPLTVTTPSRSAQGPGSAVVRDFHELRHWEITLSLSRITYSPTRITPETCKMRSRQGL